MLDCSWSARAGGSVSAMRSARRTVQRGHGLGFPEQQVAYFGISLVQQRLHAEQAREVSPQSPITPAIRLDAGPWQGRRQLGV